VLRLIFAFTSNAQAVVRERRMGSAGGERGPLCGHRERNLAMKIGPGSWSQGAGARGLGERLGGVDEVAAESA
jgi:hypothetical protein